MEMRIWRSRSRRAWRQGQGQLPWALALTLQLLSLSLPFRGPGDCLGARSLLAREGANLGSP